METAGLSNQQATGDSLTAGSAYAPYIQHEGEQNQLHLHVDGMHCARCIWAIESTLQQEKDVVSARVNLSTSRLHLVWNSTPERADALISKVEGLGYHVSALSKDRETPKETAFLLRCMAVAGFAMGNIMLLSVALWSSNAEVMGLATHTLMHWISAIIALPAIAYAGRPFFSSAWSVLKHGHTNMDVPISLAVILASGMSVIEMLRGGEHTYFDSAVMLLFFLLVGRWLDAKARGKAREHASELLELMQGTATVIVDGKAKHIAISELKEGDIIRVAAGEKIPTDVIISEGESEIDTSLVTGESLPREAKQGDTLYGGTLNMRAVLTCRVLQASDDSLLADIIRLMEQAEQGRARYVRLADKAAQLYTPVVHSLAAAAFLGWYFIGHASWQDALMVAITTLIITCPCALGLAVPAVQVLAIEWLMKRGVIVKTGDALERFSGIDGVVFDKTGTLTQGKPELEKQDLQTEYAALAAALAEQSQHPLSRAISAAYPDTRAKIEQVKEEAGEGVSAICQGKAVFLGRVRKKDAAQASGKTQVALYIEDAPVAYFTFTDPLREGAKEAVHAFSTAGMQTYLLSGDRQPITDQIANELGIAHAQGELHPNEKLQRLKDLQGEGHKLLMVGDGLNDAPALAQADISISPASGMDITQNAADIVFQKPSLLAVYDAWRMSGYSTHLVKQNFMLAVLYNCCAIPLALAGMVTPMIAAIAMSSSSLLVIGNAFRIRRYP